MVIGSALAGKQSPQCPPRAMRSPPCWGRSPNRRARLGQSRFHRELASSGGNLASHRQIAAGIAPRLYGRASYRNWRPQGHQRGFHRRTGIAHRLSRRGLLVRDVGSLFEARLQSVQPFSKLRFDDGQTVGALLSPWLSPCCPALSGAGLAGFLIAWCTSSGLMAVYRRSMAQVLCPVSRAT